MPDSATPGFISTVHKAHDVFAAHAEGAPAPADTARARQIVGDALKSRQLNDKQVYAALASLTGAIGQQVEQYGTLNKVPAAVTPNVRNDMYLASDAVRVMGGNPQGFSDDEKSTLKSLRSSLDQGTRFIPIWVKASVAIALGLGTMVGWKRIVVTVGERIGKQHLSYAQGASAEIVAAATIRNMAMAWVLTLPAAMIIAGGLYIIFRQTF